MKSIILAAISLLAVMASCTGKNVVENAGVENFSDVVAMDADVCGKWIIENIVFSDSQFVRPAEVTPDAQQYFLFTDSTYSIITNCNSFYGYYYIKGDSITLGDGMMTEMACDNMETEEAIRRILPNIATINIENDSVARLNCQNLSQYILLRKSVEENVE